MFTEQRPLKEDSWMAGFTSAIVLLITSVHHLYGAVVFNTPWRAHVAPVAALSMLVIASGLFLFERRPQSPGARMFFWAAVACIFVVPVGLIGLFEGGYNHLLKNILYFSGVPQRVMNGLFPAPKYEMPNNLFFEITGIATFFASLPAAYYGYRLLEKGRRKRRDEQTMLRPDSVIARRELVSISGTAVTIPDPNGRIHLQFRRFAGCPVCNLHLRSMARRQKEIVAAGIREIVIFHSTAEELLKYESDLPFLVVADPGKRLYRDFGVESSPRALLDPRVWPTIIQAVLHSLWRVLRRRQPVPSINPAGGSFGLPADFLIDCDGRVLAAKYGVHADDQWSVDELLALVPTLPLPCSQPLEAEHAVAG